MAVLKLAEFGLPVPDMRLELGTSTATFFKWRVKFGGRNTSIVIRMKDLETKTDVCARCTQKISAGRDRQRAPC
jgi:putative transposase